MAKKTIRNWIIGFVIASIILCLMLVYIILFPKNVFVDSYQSIIQDKYAKLVTTDERKIVIIGGSSLSFGLDDAMLEELTGLKVVNLGLHGGFGGLFNSEISKENINPGDIVLVGLEYGWEKESYFKEFGVDLIMSGIDNKCEMYKHIPFYEWPKLIGYMPTYYIKKANYTPEEGVYSRKAFENGIMTYEREFIFDDYDPQLYPVKVDLTNFEISDYSAKYLIKYKEYMENHGASVYFIAPVLYDKALVSDVSWLGRMVEEEEKTIGIEYISDPKDYLFDSEYIYDTMYHCSSSGQIKRTEMLAEDIISSGILDR